MLKDQSRQQRRKPTGTVVPASAAKPRRHSGSILLKAQSRQQRRMHRLTKDPHGPQMKRIDTLVSAQHYVLFDEIRMCGMFTIRDAVERGIEAFAVAMIMAGGSGKESLMLALDAAEAERERAAEKKSAAKLASE